MRSYRQAAMCWHAPSLLCSAASNHISMAPAAFRQLTALEQVLYKYLALLLQTDMENAPVLFAASAHEIGRPATDTSLTDRSQIS